MTKKILSAVLTILMVLSVVPMGITASATDDPDYLTFKSDDSFIIVVPNNNSYEGTLQYSTDKTNWSDVEKGTIISSSTDTEHTLYFRGEKNTVITGGRSSGWTMLSSGADVYASGNIMTLLDYKNPDSVTMGDYAFNSMFSSWTSLKTAPKLPATTLAIGCYDNMFYNCTSLTTAPELPAKNLADQCYINMFNGCTSLEITPELPATTLPALCYGDMFSGCTSLTRLPDLSKVESAEKGAMISMFSNCSGIILYKTYQGEKATWTAPNVNSGYMNNMLKGTCGDNIETPDQNTTYYYAPDYLRFKSNSSFIIVVPNNNSYEGTLQYSTDKTNWTDVVKGTVILSSADTNHMLYFRGEKNTVITGRRSSGWTMLSDGSDVYASGNIMTLLDYKNSDSVTMGEYAFYHMFDNWTNLKTAPKLTATTLSYSCYENMFSECTNLAVAPELPATTLAQRCYYNMFYKCTSLTTAPELPAKNLVGECYMDMFRECTKLESTPELPATSLPARCYGDMFSGCTSLTRLPDLSKVESAEKGAMISMFSNCSGIFLYKTYQGEESTWTAPNVNSGYMNNMLKGTCGDNIETPDQNTTYYYGNATSPADSGGSITPSDTTVKPSLAKKSASLKSGKTAKISVKNASGSKITYKSSNSKVAKVTAKGVVTALKKGNAKITVTVGTTKLTYSVKVTSSPKLSKKTITVNRGKTVKVKITGKASGVNNSYTNTKYAKVTSSKSATTLKIKGLKKGTSTLKIKVNGYICKLKIKVK